MHAWFRRGELPGRTRPRRSARARALPPSTLRPQSRDNARPARTNAGQTRNNGLYWRPFHCPSLPSAAARSAGSQAGTAARATPGNALRQLLLLRR